jgi:hypothetical protein
VRPRTCHETYGTLAISAGVTRTALTPSSAKRLDATPVAGGKEFDTLPNSRDIASVVSNLMSGGAGRGLKGRASLQSMRGGGTRGIFSAILRDWLKCPAPDLTSNPNTEVKPPLCPP